MHGDPVHGPTRLDDCRYCGARIGWVLQPRQRWIPVDPNPHPAGGVALLDDGFHGVNLDEAWVPPAANRAFRTPGVPRYVSHHLTCAGRGGVRPIGFVLAGGSNDPINEARRLENLRRDRLRDFEDRCDSGTWWG